VFTERKKTVLVERKVLLTFMALGNQPSSGRVGYDEFEALAVEFLKEHGLDPGERLDPSPYDAGDIRAQEECEAGFRAWLGGRGIIVLDYEECPYAP